MRRAKNLLLAGALAVGLTLGAAAPAMADIVNVGGGTWNYGTSYQPPWYKNVWSNYVHPSLYHSSTAIGGSANQKVYANAGSWSNASVVCGSAESTAAYWATY